MENSISPKSSPSPDSSTFTMGISGAPSPPLLSCSAFCSYQPKYLPPHLFFFFPFQARGGRKFNSSGCLHLFLPSAAQTRIWIWRWKTLRGCPCDTQITQSHSSKRAAGFGQEWEALPDLSFFAGLCSFSKSCFLNLQIFSNLALWVKTPQQGKKRMSVHADI